MKVEVDIRDRGWDSRSESRSRIGFGIRVETEFQDLVYGRGLVSE